MGLSNAKLKESARFTWRGKWEKFGDVLADKKVTLSCLMNSNMVKREKFDHIHLVTPQNGQTHFSNSSVVAGELFDHWLKSILGRDKR